jgi:hypothetical protein
MSYKFFIVPVNKRVKLGHELGVVYGVVGVEGQLADLVETVFDKVGQIAVY